jgi:hypothetical protein
MRATFPDFFPKRMTSIAEILADPFYIIDFDAISPSIPTAEGKKRQVIYFENVEVVLIDSRLSPPAPLAPTPDELFPRLDDPISDPF